MTTPSEEQKAADAFDRGASRSTTTTGSTPRARSSRPPRTTLGRGSFYGYVEEARGKRAERS